MRWSSRVNRRALEALIHCGAFDNRVQPEPVNSRPDLWSTGHNRAKDRVTGQVNLFDWYDEGTGASMALNLPQKLPLKDFRSRKKLRLEKNC